MPADGVKVAVGVDPCIGLKTLGEFEADPRSADHADGGATLSARPASVTRLPCYSTVPRLRRNVPVQSGLCNNVLSH
jgi:hypothetical protein